MVIVSLCKALDALHQLCDIIPAITLQTWNYYLLGVIKETWVQNFNDFFKCYRATRVADQELKSSTAAMENSVEIS